MNETGVAFIGCGAMGGAIVRAICKNYNPKSVTVCARHFENAQRIAEETGCNAAHSNADAVQNARYVFLAVKPRNVAEVVEEIDNALAQDAVLISLAAGVTLEKLRAFTRRPLLRIMPNTPAQIGEAMIALACESDVSENDIANITRLLECAGKVERIDEKLINCAGAVSGSGPAYVFMFIEALADAAVRYGMSRSNAYLYAAQTVKGAADMVLEEKKHPAALKDEVCSPGGTTIEAVAALEKAGFRNAIFDAVKAAYEKTFAMESAK